MRLRNSILGLSLAAALFAAGSALLAPHAAQAQIDTGLQQVGQVVKLPSTDPRVIAVNIINVALGVIGIILVALLVYAGFVYMTSGGDAEKTAKAKKIILNAIIGLIIVLSAWAIVRFVIEGLLTATQEGTGAGGTPSGQGGGFGGAGTGTSFKVTSISPKGDVPLKPRNSQIKITFSKAVDEASASAITLVKDGGTTVGGSLAVQGTLVTFTPTQACPTPNESKKCLEADSGFTVKVGNAVKSSQGQGLSCTGLNKPCEAHFKTGNTVDVAPPSVMLTYPTEGMSVQANFAQDVLASAQDDSGVALVEFFDGAKSIGIVGAPGDTPLKFEAKIFWDTTGVPVGPHTLSATADDVDTNSAKSVGVGVMLRPEHCFNAKQDVDKGETGVDCGGDANSPEYCGACSGAACTSNAQCVSGFCINNICVDKPVIKSITPMDGRPGTFVTLSGIGFGSTGSVTFLGDPNNSADDRAANVPAACTNLKGWSNTQAIVAVPDGAASGPIAIKNGTSGLSDRSDQDPGPKLENFLVNDVTRPGLCAVSPAAETVGKEVDAVGQGFGTTPGKIFFGSEDYVLSATPWADTKAHFKLPVVNSGPYDVAVRVGTLESNKVVFTVLEKTLDAVPTLDSIDPAQGQRQEYLTLYGKNLGFSLGSVIFSNGLSEAVGDASFPSTCSAGFWRDDRIIVKAPSTFLNNQPTSDGKYEVKVKRQDGKLTNALTFTLLPGVSDKPGICAIEPAVGPVGTPIKIFGDRFGFDKPNVTFYPNKPGAVGSYTNQEVQSQVPQNAQSGPVVLSTAKAKSNGVNFQVRNCNEAPEICGPLNKYQCCPTGECRGKDEACGVVTPYSEFAWHTSTGLMPLAPYVIEECAPSVPPTPSPSPWLNRAGGDQAPVDASIKLRFSQALDAASVKPASFLLYKCTGKNEDPCQAPANRVAQIFNLALTHESNTQDVVTLTLLDSKTNNKFATGTTYLVDATTDIKGAGESGDFMLAAPNCGTGPKGEKLGYCFKFKTKDTDEPSQVGAVGLNPANYTMHDAGESTQYEALPVAAGDKCIVLNCDVYDWNWKASDARASVDNFIKPKACRQPVTGHFETGNVPVDISANLDKTALSGLGQLYVNFLPPRVTDYAPQCDEACSNALVWAQFSGKLDAVSVLDPKNIEVRKCLNESCYTAEMSAPLLASVSLGPDETEIDVMLKNGGQFDPGGFYSVFLKGGPNALDPLTKENTGIQGKNGVPMTGLNQFAGFSWTFRIKQGDNAYCAPEKVEVMPAKKVETNDKGRQLFTATPQSKPDKCSADGQKLANPNGAAWNAKDVTVADFWRLNGSLMTTLRDKLPAGCLQNCRAAGAGGVQNKVAVCGNGIIETTDNTFCKAGKTPKGDACKLMPSGAQAGEECEPGIDGLDICDKDVCLFKPVPLVAAGGTCGNGIVDQAQGETCDFGPTCLGGAATGTSPVPDDTPCLELAAKAACEAAGGTCSVHEYRGCSTGCRHLGAQAGKTTCGNGDVVGDGKDCDDGNTTIGDGCSQDCLHEGSKSNTQISAVCGNGSLEPGETCEKNSSNDPAFPPGCNSTTCLRSGTIACSVGEILNCCGNARLDAGEDCDDGNALGGDGCGVTCLAEGSGAYYSNPKGQTAPSFCGNGVLETGEECEIGASSNFVANQIALNIKNLKSTLYADAMKGILGHVYSAVKGPPDAAQLAYIVGLKLPDPQTGMALTTLTATILGKSGEAAYGLQCGYTSEAQCASGFGLDQSGCCRERPKLSQSFPAAGQAVCRNAQISFEFNSAMQAGSVVNSFELASQPEGKECPQGTKEAFIPKTYGPGWQNKFKQAWDNIVAWFTGTPAYAEKWCVGGVGGQLEPMNGSATATRFIYNLDKVLAPHTTYRILLHGDKDLDDNTAVEGRVGLKSSFGVVSDGDIAWKFQTTDQICAVNVITVSDVTKEELGQEHPYLFINANNSAETRDFAAQAQAIENGVAIALSSTAEYKWTWLPWSSSDPKLVDVASAQNPKNIKPKQDFNSLVGGGKQPNGSAVLTATLKVEVDSVSLPSTKGTVLDGTAHVAVLACENPWPTLNTSPFRDMQNSANLKNTIFSGGPFFNFATMYCRDAGGAHDKTDDLPTMLINAVPATLADKDQGILRQYLFTYDPKINPELTKDGVGIRIMENPMHLSPQEWYASRGFKGKPKVALLDGYPALLDEGTAYVAAANRVASDGPIYSNMYIISRNPDAQPETLEIYGQMVKYLAFNINLTQQSNTCRIPAGGGTTEPYVVKETGRPVFCTADWECLYLDAANDLRCDSFKAKLARDTIRLADFQRINGMLVAGVSSIGRYPELLSGSYLKNTSNSLWPSWSAELGKILGALPTDPINKFLSCGRCEKSQKPCQTTNDCAENEACKGYSLQKGVWQADPDIDPQTCWQSKKMEFTCPMFKPGNPYSVSRLYQYTSKSAGTQYILGAEFEVPPENPKTWWSPPLPSAVYRCVNTEAYGNYCNGQNGGASDALCQVKKCAKAGNACQLAKDCPAGDTCQPTPLTVGSCRQFGGTFLYKDVCTGSKFADAGTCGDGVKNLNEACEIGETKPVSCTTADNKPGHKQQACKFDCTGFADDPQHPQCVADAQCGNGRVDKSCGGEKADPACLLEADCTNNKACLPEEACDDGVLNGSYGHCNASCTGYAGYCGDNQLSPGEICDKGPLNGTWSSQLDPASCAVDCKGNGPYCGDTTVDGPNEECDGTSETTGRALCVGKTNIIQPKTTTPCDSDADCTPSELCGKYNGLTKTFFPYDGKQAYSYVACTDLFKTVDGIKRETQHVRTCKPPSGQNDACHRNLWTECQPIGMCGDGIKNQNEECDDGAGNGDTKPCLKACKKNLCGDGYLNLNVEECDNGAQNGQVTCNADYDSTCLACSQSCKFMAAAGGYCGDGIKNGPEQCDGKDGLTSNGQAVTCQALGYDYAEVPSDAFKTKFNLGNTPPPPPDPNAKCTMSCQFGGCKKCSQDKGTGLIQGQVRDVVWQNQPVPGARISLMYKGVKVDETFTDENGKFKFNTLNTSPACTTYKIVVDSYADNPCTGADKTRPKCNSSTWNANNIVDESINGGYWPYTSGAFSKDNFKTDGVNNANGTIFLMPRVGKYETLTVVSWTSAPNSTVDPHLILPAGLAYNEIYNPNWPTTPYPVSAHDNDCLDPNSCSQLAYGICGQTQKRDIDELFNYASCGGADCKRDIYWYMVGKRDLNQYPYARLYCVKENTTCESCEGGNVSPMVSKFSRKLSGGGTYEFYVADYFNVWQNANDDFHTNGLKTTVVTQLEVRDYFPPQGVGQIWHVFSQTGGSDIEVTESKEWLSKSKRCALNMSDIGPGQPDCP